MGSSQHEERIQDFAAWKPEQFRIKREVRFEKEVRVDKRIRIREGEVQVTYTEKMS